ncbi:MAG: histidine phosphatase family protein [Planctomycetota bacterium]|nr:histidine phosphatase family protein [Planctomycetota bacterium]
MTENLLKKEGNEKTLLLMRHAKSSWEEASRADFDRPLNRRGKSAAPRMAGVLQERNLLPQKIIASSAKRTRQTAELLTATWGNSCPVLLEDELYLASPQVCLKSLAEHCGEEATVLLIGHNPGMEGLVEMLTGEDEIMPTAAVAILTFAGSWSRLTGSRLLQVLRPRELSTGEELSREL